MGTWSGERRRGYRRKPDWVGQLQPEKEGAPRVNVSGDSGKSGWNSRPVCLSRKEQPIKGLDVNSKPCSWEHLEPRTGHKSETSHTRNKASDMWGRGHTDQETPPQDPSRYPLTSLWLFWASQTFCIPAEKTKPPFKVESLWFLFTRVTLSAWRFNNSIKKARFLTFNI